MQELNLTYLMTLRLLLEKLREKVVKELLMLLLIGLKKIIYTKLQQVQKDTSYRDLMEFFGEK